jgi:basic membrane protein A
MRQNLARGLVAAMLAAFAAATSAQSPAQSAKAPLKVAFVYVSPIGEAGWTFQHDQARQAMQKALGAQVQTTVVEAVAEGADSERVMRDLARQGHGLIVASSFGYLEPALRVAAEFPNVRFEHAGGYKTAPNLSTYNARFYEARYLAGMLAGQASKSGVAGYVAGFPVPEVVQGINAFTLGMRAVNPKAQVKLVWLNTWFDPAREREAAQALVDQGADVLVNHSGSPAVPQTAQANFRAKGVRTVGYQSDMRRFAPDAQLAAVVPDWSGHYIRAAQAVLDGKWQPRPVWGGMKDGMVQLVAVDPALPVELRRLVDARRATIVAGSFKPFGAPLKDNAGTLRLAQGTLDDGAIATMNWLVEGVVGTVPGQ